MGSFCLRLQHFHRRYLSLFTSSSNSIWVSCLPWHRLCSRTNSQLVGSKFPIVVPADHRTCDCWIWSPKDLSRGSNETTCEVRPGSGSATNMNWNRERVSPHATFPRGCQGERKLKNEPLLNQMAADTMVFHNLVSPTLENAYERACLHKSRYSPHGNGSTRTRSTSRSISESRNLLHQATSI